MAKSTKQKTGKVTKSSGRKAAVEETEEETVSERKTGIDHVLHRVVEEEYVQPNWTAFQQYVLDHGGPEIDVEHIGICVTGYKYFQKSDHALSAREEVAAAREQARAQKEEDAERRAQERAAKEAEKAEKAAAREEKAATKKATAGKSATKKTAASASKPTTKKAVAKKATPAKKAAPAGKVDRKTTRTRTSKTKAAF
jgi:hypothetical protein